MHALLHLKQFVHQNLIVVMVQPEFVGFLNDKKDCQLLFRQNLDMPHFIKQRLLHSRQVYD
jgi:hypothetical protein